MDVVGIFADVDALNAANDAADVFRTNGRDELSGRARNVARALSVRLGRDDAN